MPAFKTEVPHSFTQEEALEKIKSFVESANERFKDQVSEFEGNWVDSTYEFKMKTYGIALSGQMIVRDSSVEISGTLPMAAMMFKGKIEKSLASELEKVLK